VQWVLTPDEFVHVWATETGLDYRPYPVNALLPAPSDAGPEVRGHLRRNADSDLSAALLLCARADATTLTVSGERSAGDAERILAFAAVAQQHAAILVARPESMVVLICHAQAVGERLVGVIGSAPAGRHGAMREPTDDVLDWPAASGPEAAAERHHAGPAGGLDRHSPAASGPEAAAERHHAGPAGGLHRHSPDPSTGAARFQRALRAPVDCRGIVTVTIAPHNPAPSPTRHRSWLDVAGDGRYLLTTADQLTLTPVDDEAFADHLLRLAGLL